MNYILRMSTGSDQGKVRKRNEDWVTALPAAGLVLLADGMGGHQGGNVASRLAVDIVCRELLDSMENGNGSLPEDDTFMELLQTANDTIVDQARDNPDLSGMGSTLVLACFAERDYAVVHVGDSRCYLLEEDKMECVTEDHTLAQHYVSQGILKPDEVRSWQGRNMLMRGLGIDGEVLPDIARGRLRGNERFMLCSDGVTDVMSDDDIQQHLMRHDQQADAVVQGLIDCANDRGGPDNITAAIVDVIKLDTPPASVGE